MNVEIRLVCLVKEKKKFQKKIRNEKEAMGAQRFNPGGLQRTSKGKIHFQLNVPYTDSPCTLQSKQP